VQTVSAVSPVRLAFNHDRSRAAFRLFDSKGNCLTAAMMRALRTALEPLGENPHLKLVTVDGEGADFSFGASIPEHAPDRIGDVLPLMHELVADLLDVPAPTAAIVRGRCLGGGFELALACDFIFASDDAVLGLPEIDLGVFPPVAAALLPWKVGAARASRAILTGVRLPVREWQQTGLIELTAPGDELPAALDAWFEARLAPKSAVALRHASLAARASMTGHFRSVIPVLERLYLDDLMQTADAAEGIAAFMDKRPPKWLDR
jgi:cyclohexa-1,5-dienecarbonyl-CoA hydratase